MNHWVTRTHALEWKANKGGMFSELQGGSWKKSTVLISWPKNEGNEVSEDKCTWSPPKGHSTKQIWHVTWSIRSKNLASTIETMKSPKRKLIEKGRAYVHLSKAPRLLPIKLAQWGSNSPFLLPFQCSWAGYENQPRNELFALDKKEFKGEGWG